MKIQSKTLLAFATSACLGLMASSALAATAIPLTWDNSVGSASFEGNKGQSEFSIDLSALRGTGDVYITLSSTFGPASGFDITGASFDGQSFEAIRNNDSTKGGAPVGFDTWFFQGSELSKGVHHFTVSGLTRGGGFNGTVHIQDVPLPAVPEPSSYALLLAGMGVVGLVARRRGMKG